MRAKCYTLIFIGRPFHNSRGRTRLPAYAEPVQRFACLETRDYIQDPWVTASAEYIGWERVCSSVPTPCPGSMAAGVSAHQLAQHLKKYLSTDVVN